MDGGFAAPQDLFVGTAALTFAIAYELAGPAASPLAALIYTTSVGTFLFGRFVFTDTLLVFSTTLSLHGLVRISRQRAGPGPAISFYLGMALAGLTKGLIGLLFPIATAVAYALLSEGRGFWRRPTNACSGQMRARSSRRWERSWPSCW